MNAGPRDVAQVRLDNALGLFDEFVKHTVKDPDAAALRGLERRFAERLQIQPSYWSQIKGRSRQIGERLARQFEQLCHKPYGWMDEAHGPGAVLAARLAPASSGAVPPTPRAPGDDGDDGDELRPQDDDERFIMGLVLTFYRRHPQRARTRLLDLLGEVLTPTPVAPRATAKPGSTPKSERATGTGAAGPAPGKAPITEPTTSLWRQVSAGVAPLKRKR